MNKDQVTGKVERVAGRVKQGVGEAVGDQKLANQGVADQVKGAARETWGNVKDAAAVTADNREKEAQHQANNARADVRRRVETVHEAVNDKIDAHKEAERQKGKSA
ncbi:MAG: CsbD family protein [Acidobacteriaceae bacterium]